jgi:frataxin
MLDESAFRTHSDRALEALMKALLKAEEEGGFEVEENSGAIHILFEESGTKFVITPNTPVRQIWISALATSFKLDWSDQANDFVLPKDGTPLQPLVERLIQQQLASE